MGVFQAIPKDPLKRFLLDIVRRKENGPIWLEQYKLNKISKACMEKEFFNSCLREFQLEGQDYMINLNNYVELINATRRLRRVVKELNYFFPGFLDRRNVPVAQLVSDKGLFRLFRLQTFKRPFTRRNVFLWNNYFLNDVMKLKVLALKTVPRSVGFRVAVQNAEILRSKLVTVINSDKSAISPELSYNHYSDLIGYITPGASFDAQLSHTPKHVLAKLVRNKISTIIRIGIRTFRTYADSFVSYSSAEYGPCSEIRFRFELSPWGLVAYNPFSYKEGKRAILSRPSVIGPVGWKRSELQKLDDNFNSFDFSPPRGSVRDRLWCDINDRLYPKV